MLHSHLIAMRVLITYMFENHSYIWIRGKIHKCILEHNSQGDEASHSTNNVKYDLLFFESAIYGQKLSRGPLYNIRREPKRAIV